MFYVVGKMCSSYGVFSMYVVAMEVFPTTSRNSLTNIANTVGRLGSVLAPQAPLLVNFFKFIFRFKCFNSPLHYAYTHRAIAIIYCHGYSIECIPPVKYGLKSYTQLHFRCHRELSLDPHRNQCESFLID